MEHLYKRHIIMFVVMVLVGMMFNPMNILAYDISHIYMSLTLFYSGLLMASNMIWAHEIVHYLDKGHFNKNVFIIGIIFSIFSIFLLRKQLFVEGNNWLRRMIPHHSTALTTTSKLIEKNKSIKENSKLYRLAQDIVYNQEREILFMKSML